MPSSSISLFVYYLGSQKHTQWIHICALATVAEIPNYISPSSTTTYAMSILLYILVPHFHLREFLLRRCHLPKGTIKHKPIVDKIGHKT